MGTSTVKGGHHWPHHDPHVASVPLSASELAAAHQALASLNLSPALAANSASLLSGSGSDTFAGGVAGSARYLPGFASETMSGASGAPSVAKMAVAANAGIPLSGDTAAGVKALDTPVTTGGQVLTLNDQTTIHLIGVNNDSVGKA